MTVKITKPEINIREKLVELDSKQDKLIQRPAFSCASSGTYTATTGPQNLSTFVQSNTVSLNAGGHLVGGKFTAPIGGLYHFDLKASAVFSSGYLLLYIYKNGAAMTNHSIYFYQTSNSDTLSFTIYAQAGDYFEPYVNTNYAGGALSSLLFSGHYIG
jgi:hypothetical protein